MNFNFLNAHGGETDGSGHLTDRGKNDFFTNQITAGNRSIKEYKKFFSGDYKLKDVLNPGGVLANPGQHLADPGNFASADTQQSSFDYEVLGKKAPGEGERIGDRNHLGGAIALAAFGGSAAGAAYGGGSAASGAGSGGATSTGSAGVPTLGGVSGEAGSGGLSAVGATPGGTIGGTTGATQAPGSMGMGANVSHYAAEAAPYVVQAVAGQMGPKPSQASGGGGGYTGSSLTQPTQSDPSKFSGGINLGATPEGEPGPDSVTMTQDSNGMTTTMTKANPKPDYYGRNDPYEMQGAVPIHNPKPIPGVSYNFLL
jgi:hypothetical protein